MNCRIAELQYKEVVDITDGTRYGFIGDLEVDTETGLIKNIILAEKHRLGGLFGRCSESVFPWSAIKRIGSDIILVDSSGCIPQKSSIAPEKTQFFLKNK